MQSFEQNIAIATVAVKKKMDAYLQKLSPELMQAAIEYSALSGAKGWRYVQAVLDSCIERGIATPQEFEESCRAHSHKSAAPAVRNTGWYSPSYSAEHSAAGQSGGLNDRLNRGESSIDFEAIQRYMMNATP